ncbi:MAG: hypothetical protein NW241_02680 [Bacteroidia bacterium]|nr:hypothetical protein [Bacteroidia bacterium]
MLRLLTQIPPALHLLLLVLIPLLRLPSLIGGWYQAEESLLLLTAERMAAGGRLYQDAWFAGPPLLVWLYEGCYALFGGGAIRAVRILTCLYLYLTAACFGGLVARYKPFREAGWLPPVLLAFLTATPWYAQELNGAVWSLLPMVMAYDAVLRLSDSAEASYAGMFRAGIWMMLAVLGSYQAFFLLPAIAGAYVLLRTPRAAELYALLGGLLAPSLFLATGLYFSGGLEAFWDIGVLGFFDALRAEEPGIWPLGPDSFRYWALSVAVPAILAVIGFIHFRIRFFSYLVKIRYVETAMAVWVTVGLLLLLLAPGRREVSDFSLLLPPIAFYSSKTLDFKLIYRFRLILLILALIVPVSQTAAYFRLRLPAGAPGRPDAASVWLHGGAWQQVTPPAALEEIRRHPEWQEVWILDHYPGWHHLLNRFHSLKYTDFRLLKVKYPLLGGQTRPWSGAVGDEDFYQQLAAHPPDLIVDTGNRFPPVQQRYPALLSSYVRQDLAGVTVFVRQVTE